MLVRSAVLFVTANQKHGGEIPFGDGDARLKLVVPPEKRDPRIHFALVCGAKSCPPIKVYKPDNLDYALDMATAVSCSSSLAYGASGRASS